jgi:hypothetical protein
MNRRYFPLAAPARMSAQRAAAATPPAIAAAPAGAAAVPARAAALASGVAALLRHPSRSKVLRDYLD